MSRKSLFPAPVFPALLGFLATVGIAILLLGGPAKAGTFGVIEAPCPENPIEAIGLQGCEKFVPMHWNEIFDRDLSSWQLTANEVETGIKIWSLVIEDGRGLGRIEFVHVPGEAGYTHFVSHRPCENGELAWGRTKVGWFGNDIGENCDGSFPHPPIIASLPLYIVHLPEEAKAILEEVTAGDE